MNPFQNIGIRDYFIRYGLKYGTYRAMFTKFPVHIVKDYENKKILYYYKASKYLSKYRDYAGVDPEAIQYGQCSTETPIWVYWKQGVDEAPEIVKKCIQSIFRFEGGRVILLSDFSINNYITIPEEITAKVKSGKMSTAAYSDLIRLSLLEQFGGTWIDATVLLTGKLPDYVCSADFFAYQDTFGKITNPAPIANWLMYSTPHNEIIRQTRNMSYAYWKKEKYAVEYLLSYVFLRMAVENTSGWEKIPYANSDYCHLMFDALDRKYDENLIKHYKELSTVHKLSYKLKNDVLQNKGNIYHAIINDEI